MAWVEQRGRQFRVYERVEGKRAFEPFATRDDADAFRHLVAVLGWHTAVDKVRQPVAVDPAPPAVAALPRTPARVPATPLADLRPSGLTVGDLCRAYITIATARRSKKRKGPIEAKTVAQYQSYIQLHIEPYFGDIDAGFVLAEPHADDERLPSAVTFRLHLQTKPKAINVRRDETGAIVTAETHTVGLLSDSTIRKVCAFVSSAYASALRADVSRVVDRNPFAGAAGDTADPKRVEADMWLTPEQALLLLDAITPHYRPLVLFLLLTGLRWSEAAGLQVKHLHLDGHDPRVDVVTALKRRKKAAGGGWYLGRLKTAGSLRTVGLPPLLVEELRALTAGVDGEALVFRTVKGEALHHGNFIDQYLRPAIGRCGGRVPASFRPHGLRHTCATWLLQQGRTIHQVARQLGHADSGVTERVYGHVTPTLRQENAAAAQANLTGRDPEPAPPSPLPPEPQFPLARHLEAVPDLDDADRDLPEVDHDDEVA